MQISLHVFVICLHSILGQKVCKLLIQDSSGMPSLSVGIVEGVISHLNNS